VSPNAAPAVTSNPFSQTGYAGTTLTFTASASGTPTPSVQWQVSTNRGSSWANYTGSGAASPSVTSASLTTSESGWEVRAVFTNVAGIATTSAATITVLKDVAPRVTTQPSNETVSPGSTASFSAAASGAPAPSVQWRVSINGGATWTAVAGATSTTLSFAATAAENGRKFEAVFTNPGGSATTKVVTLKT
jgi:Immunoglobulin I-set domain